MTLIELLVTLAIIGLTAGLLPNFIAVSTKIPKAGSARSHVQEFRHVHLFIEKTIRAADTIVIDGHNVYVQDMETPRYYDLYTFVPASHMLYRDKYYDNFTPLNNGSRSQLDAEVVVFELAPEWEGDAPNGRFRLKMQYTGDANVYETEIYAPKHAQSITVRTP
jgi:prepilin-type N-terminal cleavage/methylation domain-containing protein